MIKGLNFYKEIKKSKKSLDDLNLFERAKRSYINQIALLNIGNIIYFELVEEFIPKEILVFEELKSLNVIEFAFIDRKTIQVKTLQKPKAILNKGLEIRAKKHERQAKKRYTVKETQESLIRIVNVDYPVFKRENGKTRFDKMDKGQGVQVENKVYFSNNFIFINKKRVKLKEVKDLSKVSDEILKLFEEKKESNNRIGMRQRLV